MDLITLSSKGTINFINKHDLINKTFTRERYLYIENLIKKYRHKDVKITENHIKELVENGLMILFGELFKYLIVLSIAWVLGIFLSTFMIMNSFSLLRRIAGGVHMSTFNKCFAVMILFFLALGYSASLLYNICATVVFIVLGFIWSMVMAIKYAPQEREDKSDKDCDNGNVMKRRTKIFIVLFFIISMMLVLFTNQYTIGIGIFVGMLLEIFTITPMGTKIFRYIDNKKVV